MASSEISGRDVPISKPDSDDDQRCFGHGYMGHDFPARFLPPPFSNQDRPVRPYGDFHGFPRMSHPSVDPRLNDHRPDPRISHHPLPFGFDPGAMHERHDFWGRAGHNHETPKFRPPHPGRPFPPYGPRLPFCYFDFHRCPCIQDWWSNAHVCPWMRGHATSDAATDRKKEFRVALDVSQFQPDDLNVTVIDGHVQLHGKHEERQDQHGFITREFARRYPLPVNVDPGTVKSSLGVGKVLSVFAPRKEEHSEKCTAHDFDVPINIKNDSQTPMAESD